MGCIINIDITFHKFDNCIVEGEENILVFRKHM
jgi:hypothetical protein